jgi:hypothetical protein
MPAAEFPERPDNYIKGAIGSQYPAGSIVLPLLPCIKDRSLGRLVKLPTLIIPR